MEWEFYKEAWEAERALKAAVPTAWLVKGGMAFAVVKFPREAEPQERWAEKTWVAVPWISNPGRGFGEVFLRQIRQGASLYPRRNKRHESLGASAAELAKF
jgi:hypothetical protein